MGKPTRANAQELNALPSECPCLADRRFREASVLVIVSRFPEPSQTFVVDHLRGLVRHGWSVHLAARSIDSEGVRKLGLPELEGVRFHLLQAPGRRQPFRRLICMLSLTGVTQISLLRSVTFRAAAYFAPSLRSVITDVDPAVVHAHFAHNGLLAAAAMRARLPLLITFHGYDVLELPRRGGWKPYQLYLDDCDGVVHSSFLEAHVLSRLSIRVHRVTLGVDQELFRHTERPDRWSVPLHLLTVGRLVPQKGHAFAIKALYRLASTRGDLDPGLRIVGNGPERGELEALVAHLGLSDRVHFLGALPYREVAQEMGECDVLLVPSIRLAGSEETFSRVALEGLASGLPVVATKIGGLPDTLGDAGYIVPPNDSTALSDTVSHLIDSESPYSISGRARARASEFSIERMWADYSRVTNLVAQTK